jgi:hypothetical protein
MEQLGPPQNAIGRLAQIAAAKVNGILRDASRLIAFSTECHKLIWHDKLLSRPIRPRPPIRR